MSDEQPSDPGSDPGGYDEAPDSMEAVLAEALAEDSRDGAAFDEGATSLDDVDIRDALRSAMKPPADRISIRSKVHKKLREDPELQGRYFADGWSTSKSPKETYLVTSLVMLLVVALVYLLIRPYGL